MRPAEAASVVRIAAPVGVTSSAFIPVSTTGKPRRSSTVPGAGTGIRPCGPPTVPPPTGSAETWTACTPARSSATTPPVTSTIASTAPTSWNCTASRSVPCTRASASASRVKMRVARSRTLVPSVLRSRMSRMSRSDRCCRCARPSISTSTLVARKSPFITSRATSVHPGSASFVSSALSSSSDTPASKIDAMIMSPAAPLGQSK